LLELRLVDRFGALGAAAARGRERLRDLLFLGAFGFEAERALLLLLERLGALGAAAARAFDPFRERLRDWLAFLFGALGFEDERVLLRLLERLGALGAAFDLLRERLRLRALLERDMLFFALLGFLAEFLARRLLERERDRIEPRFLLEPLLARFAERERETLFLLAERERFFATLFLLAERDLDLLLVSCFDPLGLVAGTSSSAAEDGAEAGASSEVLESPFG